MLDRREEQEKANRIALKGTLVGYDGHTTYRVPIKNQNKVTDVKGLETFEDYETQTSTELPDCNNPTPTPQGSFLVDNDNEARENDSYKILRRPKGQRRKDIRARCFNTSRRQSQRLWRRGPGPKIDLTQAKVPSAQDPPHEGESAKDAKEKTSAQDRPHAGQSAKDVREKGQRQRFTSRRQKC